MSTIIEVENIEQHCADLARSLESADLSPVLQQILPISLQAHRDNFNSSASPQGANWTPRVETGDGHPLLMESGTLMQAAVGGAGSIMVIDGRVLVIGVDGDAIPYAAIHNYGGRIGGWAAGAMMPEREYLGMSEQRLQEADKVVADGCLVILFGTRSP